MLLSSSRTGMNESRWRAPSYEERRVCMLQRALSRLSMKMLGMRVVGISMEVLGMTRVVAC